MNRYFKRLTNMLDHYYQSQGIKNHEGYIEDRVIKYLCKESNIFKKFIKERKLEKLSGEAFSYLVSTLENKYQLADCILRERLLEKMEIIEANQNRGKAIYPDIDSLYVKLKEATGGEGFFTYLQGNLKDTNYIAAKKYEDLVDVLVSTKAAVLKNIDFCAIPWTNFAYFTKEYLKLFMDYDCDPQLKSVAFSILMTDNSKKIEKLNNLSKFEFSKSLDFMMRPDSLSSRVHMIKNLLDKEECTSFILDKIDNLPKNWIGYLDRVENVDEKMRKDQEKLLEDICKKDEQAQEYYQNILKTSKKQDSNLLELLVNDQFRKFSMETRAFLLQKLAYLDSKNLEEDQVRYRMKAQFLVGNEGNPGFLTEIDFSYFWKTFKFIQKERNIEVLDTKLLVLSRLRKQVKKKSLSAEIYGAYLESLQNTISNMDEKDQIKYLDAHSRFFEKHSLEKFAKQVNETKHKEELIEAISENRKYKNLKYSYKLVDFIARYSTMLSYDSHVASKIIERMSNCQTHKRRKAIYHILNNSSNFYQIGIAAQNEILDNTLGYPMMLESKDALDMQVLIPDYPYAQDVLKEKSEVTFRDKDTKIRIKLMRKDEKS